MSGKRLLVACECSQTVTIAFRQNGIEAYSCDLQDCYGGHPEWHIKCDVLEVIQENWHMMIAHPPCTYLSKLNAPLIARYPDRYDDTLEAAIFFKSLFESNIHHICLENPVPLHRALLPPYRQIIEPWQFGHPYTKQTCLWLKNLPPLIPDIIVKPITTMWVYEKQIVKGIGRQNQRSKTFEGIAKAMADQWGGRFFG